MGKIVVKYICNKIDWFGLSQHLTNSKHDAVHKAICALTLDAE